MNNANPLAGDNGQFALSLMVTEDMTNGVWNAILSYYFSFPEYLVVPEYHFAGGFADLAVLKLDHSGENKHKIIIIYEGKKTGGGITKLADTLAQAGNAIQKSSDQNAVLIGSLGGKFEFTDVNRVGKMKNAFTTDGTYSIKSNWKWILDKMDVIKTYDGVSGLSSN